MSIQVFQTLGLLGLCLKDSVSQKMPATLSREDETAENGFAAAVKVC